MGQAVLIADGDRARARRIGQGCEARGFATRLAGNGAAALEEALAHVPDLVVAPFELGLIDGTRLAEILRANPRTRDVRFVFLGERPAAAGDLEDEVLGFPLDEDEVVRRVERLSTRHVRMRRLSAREQKGHQLSGQLAQVPLPDLLQLLHANRRVGTLELSRRDRSGREQRGVIHLRDGDVIQATADAVEGEKALFRLLGWKSGSFAFTPERMPVAPKIQTPTRALLLEGLRQLDEWEALRGSLPPLDAQVALCVSSAALPNMVHPLTQEVLVLLELYTRVRDLVDHCSHADYQVLRTLQTLIERGIVEVRWGPPEGAPEADGVFSPAQARRLREWLDFGRDGGAGDAKLLLFETQPGSTHKFVNLLHGLPGLRLRAAEETGPASDGLQSVGRVAVDASVGIELLRVPARPEDAPIWPIVGYGALGSVFLISGPVAEASRTLAPVEAAIRALPRARLFHVLLLHKGDRPLPEELRENLSLLDDASLFLLPVDGGKDLHAVLHGFFARVLP